MTRSFNTLATVVITLVALLALGGASLKNFAFALLVGICSGGYHSIFYSAPLVLVFRKRQLEAAAKRRRAGLSQDRTVTARSRTESTALQSRERRRRAKTSSPRVASDGRRPRLRAPSRGTPQRYRRKRDDTGAIAVEEPYAGEETYTTDEQVEMDPLDAQNAGLHDQAMAQGHEAIELHFDETEEHHEQQQEEHKEEGADKA